MLEVLGDAARKASLSMAIITTEEKNALLTGISASLLREAPTILAANAKDMDVVRASGMPSSFQDRLLLTPERLEQMAADVMHIAGLPDPVGQIIDGKTVASGLQLHRKRVPLGVVGAIYEARPNVTVDIASLCLKTGNTVILRGGRETQHSSRALVQCIQIALRERDLPETAVQLIDDPDRALVIALLQLDRYVDMIIPRGGAKLQQLCKEKATIPIILGGIGVCHIFVDESADLFLSLPVIKNAKVQRPSVCNALETLLVHRNIAADFLPKLGKNLASSGVVFHACAKALPLLTAGGVQAGAVQEEDYTREWLSLDLNVRVVSGLDEALEHIRIFGSKHSEVILTQSMRNASLFINSVDAAAVYINASSRFTDGGEFGLGAEVAVSTQKLHARGPMGLEALTTYKWIGQGNYLCRE